jgi:3-oxoadipate enol-lactonase
MMISDRVPRIPDAPDGPRRRRYAAQPQTDIYEPVPFGEDHPMPATIPPVELSAIERGAGPAVMLVHGGGFHSGPTWARQIGPLAEEGFRVIAVDRRGYGRSPANNAPPGTRVPVALQARDVVATLDAREVDRAHLVGISYGSLVCLEVALASPERVLSLTLVEPVVLSLLSGDPDYDPWLARFADLESLAASGAPPSEWLAEWLGLMDAGMARSLGPGSPAWTILERSLPHQWEQERPIDYWVDEARLAALRAPVLIVNGGDSEPPLTAAAEALAELIPGARHVIIPGAGHQLHAEVPEIFNELLIGFMASYL